MAYELLLDLASSEDIQVYEKLMPPRIKGLYSDNIVWINSRIVTSIEKACALAEEIGHHYKTAGDITDQTDIANRQQEKRARSWGYEKLIPLTTFVQAHKHGIRNRYELADHIGVTEDFLDDAINRYKEKYGLTAPCGKYTICFEPLGVLEFFE